MSNYKAMRELTKRLSGQENVFTVPRIYVQYTGDLTTAILLNQIVFYSDKSKRTDGFFYKTYDEWEQEICLSKRQVSYSTEKLKALGVVETKIKRANGAPTVHYKLDYDKLVDSIVTKCHFPLEQNVTIHNDKMSLSLTESTTENTTEITTLKDNVAKAPSLPYETIVDYLNQKTGKSYRSASKKTQTLIAARINEGFTVEDFKTVIDIKTEEWLNDSKWQVYLQPSTLFGAKFENYLNQKPKGAKSNGSSQQIHRGSSSEEWDGFSL
ncbi:conserved phage C-terminal domain-containing protein [Planococcus sp. SE5232]|uniref:conserved phage C-terminal domain-containing protein n=1 Tax=unclassified Planococcus (in: firmicutes) TaxID=2662419 RepID=UPI003D6AE3C6